MNTTTSRSRQGCRDHLVAHIRRTLLWVLLVLLADNVVAGRCDPDSRCLFAVFPHTGAQQLQDTYLALAEDLSLILDTRVRLVSSSTMGRFRERLAAGEWDIALVGPGQYIFAAEPAGYRPLATSDRPITFQITTVPRTHIRRIEQLRGARLGLMWPHTGTWLMTMEMLEQAGIDPQRDLRTRAYASQRACVHALLIGLVDACGLASPILAILRQEKPAEFLTLVESEPQASALYVAHPDLAPEKQKALREYFLSRPGIHPADPTDWDHFRNIARRLGDLPK